MALDEVKSKYVGKRLGMKMVNCDTKIALRHSTYLVKCVCEVHLFHEGVVFPVSSKVKGVSAGDYAI